MTWPSAKFPNGASAPFAPSPQERHCGEPRQDPGVGIDTEIKQDAKDLRYEKRKKKTRWREIFNRGLITVSVLSPLAAATAREM